MLAGPPIDSWIFFLVLPKSITLLARRTHQFFHRHCKPRHSRICPIIAASTAASTASGSKLKHGKTSLHEGTTAFTMAEVNRATGNFSAGNIIGQGGFGTVYRGRLRDGSLIAVKRAKKVSELVFLLRRHLPVGMAAVT